MAGHEEALEMPPFDTGVRDAWKRLYGFVRSRIRDERDAEDLVQDVFQQLVASESVTEPIEDLTAWLYAVARNRVIDWYRKRRPEPLPQPHPEEGDGPGPEEMLSHPLDSPDRVFWRSAVWEELADALAELPEAQRDVFIAHELEGTSFKEIAQRTGEPLNTLLSRKRYAVLFLRERLRHLYEEIETIRQGGRK